MALQHFLNWMVAGVVRQHPRSAIRSTTVLLFITFVQHFVRLAFLMRYIDTHKCCTDFGSSMREMNGRGIPRHLEARYLLHIQYYRSCGGAADTLLDLLPQPPKELGALLPSPMVTRQPRQVGVFSNNSRPEATRTYSLPIFLPNIRFWNRNFLKGRFWLVV